MWYQRQTSPFFRSGCFRYSLLNPYSLLDEAELSEEVLPLLEEELLELDSDEEDVTLLEELWLDEDRLLLEELWLDDEDADELLVTLLLLDELAEELDKDDEDGLLVILLLLDELDEELDEELGEDELEELDDVSSSCLAKTQTL